MDIETPVHKFEPINYDDPSFEDFKKSLKKKAGDEPYYLCLFLGLYETDKIEAVREISEVTGISIEYIDFNTIVSKSEEETSQNINSLFDSFNSANSILYFENGGKLCGAYTGFTHSKVKYATPQERYFLNKLKEFNGIVIIDIPEYADADQTIRRAAHAEINFPLPDSKLKRFIWHLKHYSFHGYDLKTKRPEAYGEVSENF